MEHRGKPKKKLKLPRGTMPPPTKRFKDRKKAEDKEACRKFKQNRRNYD